MNPTAPRSGFEGLGRSEITTPDELTPVAGYLELLLDNLMPLEPITLRVDEALGHTLAEDVSSTEPLPSFANSAMDGYAVRSQDVRGASISTPVTLQVLGEVAAGSTNVPVLEAHTAMRIMTGAPLPPGADAIIPVEATTERNDRVEIVRAAVGGEFVRTVGQDVPAGQLLLRAGHRLRPADIGLLAAVGAARVHCHPAPRVAILSTGSEIVPADQTPGPGCIRDANGPMLSAMVRQIGGIPSHAGIIEDDRDKLRDAIDSNLGTSDMILVTGGISAGRYDHFQDVMRHFGTVHARKVAMKPGMPQAFAIASGVPVIGLPGNPVSSFVSFEVFVRAAIRALQARRDADRPKVQATLGQDINSPAHKRSFIRVRLQRGDAGWVARPTGHQGSHVITSLARADGLAEIPESVTRAEAGTRVTVRLLVDG